MIHVPTLRDSGYSEEAIASMVEAELTRFVRTFGVDSEIICLLIDELADEIGLIGD